MIYEYPLHKVTWKLPVVMGRKKWLKLKNSCFSSGQNPFYFEKRQRFPGRIHFISKNDRDSRAESILFRKTTEIPGQNPFYFEKWQRFSTMSEKKLDFFEWLMLTVTVNTRVSALLECSFYYVSTFTLRSPVTPGIETLTNKTAKNNRQ